METIRGASADLSIFPVYWLTFPRGKEPPPSSLSQSRARRLFPYVHAIISYPQ